MYSGTSPFHSWSQSCSIGPGNYTPNIMKCVLGTVSVAPLGLGTPFLVAIVPLVLGTAFLARHSHHTKVHMEHSLPLLLTIHHIFLTSNLEGCDAICQTRKTCRRGTGSEMTSLLHHMHGPESFLLLTCYRLGSCTIFPNHR